MKQLSLFDEPVVSKLSGTVAPLSELNWILVDGSNLLCRAYFATAMDESKIKRTKSGQAVNGVMTALRMLFNYRKAFNAPIAVFFDEGEGFRKSLFPAYKEGRGEKPQDLKTQFPIFQELLASAGIPYFMDSQLEADDLIASACKSLNGHKYVISNDKDLMQLISNDVTVVFRKGTDILYTPEKFAEDFQISPIQIIDLKALEGDSSDNIPGVKGIGKKGALELVQGFQTIEEIPSELPIAYKKYAKKLDAQGRKDAAFFKELVTLRNARPISLISYEINRNALAQKCETYELFKTIQLLNEEATFI